MFQGALTATLLFSRGTGRGRRSWRFWTRRIGRETNAVEQKSQRPLHVGRRNGPGVLRGGFLHRSLGQVIEGPGQTVSSFTEK